MHNTLMLDKTCWSISLDTPPEVVRAGRGVHGRNGNERYLLPHLWALHLYPYSAAVRLRDQRFPIRPGYVGVIPPNTPIEYEFRGVSQHLFVHFRCAPLLSQTPLSAALIPAMQDLGDDFAHRYQALETLIGDVQMPPFRIQAHLWNLLGDLTTPVPSSHPLPTAHPAVRYALRQIELRLSETLSVADLAREANVSYSYLGRLFQEAFGTTVVGYIRERRLRRAEHLLRQSTLPIKVIAAAVGIPDLHLFNKSLRRELGKSPTAVRAQGPNREGNAGS
ncbi:MAG: AraC family transcriptional regulator [Armatimonadota bacterium]